MKILAHRGAWRNEKEKNTLEALKRAVLNGWGFESDIRDYNGNLVISHNIADDNCILAESVFKMLADTKTSNYFAINIKADGLKNILVDLINKYNIKNYFCFDMSVPQLVEYQELGLKCFSRQSEYENSPVLLGKATGIWLDAFQDDTWLTEGKINGYIEQGKLVSLVSPELHQREYLPFWEKVKNADIDFSKILLCTDIPSLAEQYFKDFLS